MWCCRLWSQPRLDHYKMVRIAMQWQIIVIFRSSKWPPITFNDSQTIADDCVSPDLSQIYHRQSGSREWRSSVELRAFYFRKVSRVHFRLGNGELMFMMMEKRASASLKWNFLYFSFLKVKANVYNSSFKKEQYIEDPTFSKGCFMTVDCPMYERSSNHLKEKLKRM